MKKLKKLQALLIALAITVLMLPCTATAAETSATDISAISGVRITAAGKWEKQSSATLKYKGAEKTFTDSTYLCTPYKEIKLFNEDDIADNGPLADYDKLEFYVGLAEDSSADGQADLIIFRYQDGGKKDGTLVKQDWSAMSVHLNPGEDAQKITINLSGFDSLQINVKETADTKTDGKDTNIIFGNFKAYKSAAEFDRHTATGNVINGTKSAYLGGITQNVKGSYVSAIASGAPYYIEQKFNNIDGEKYSAMEFYLGTSSYTEVEGVEQWAQVRIMMTTDTTYNVNSGVDAFYTFKLGSEPRFVSLPITSTTKAIKMIWKHGYINESGAFTQFAADNAYGVTSGSATIGIFDCRLYKNKNAFVANRATAWNNLGTQTMGTLANVGDWWVNGTNFTMGDKGGDILYSDGKYWSQDITRLRNNADSAGSMVVSLVTEGYVDRFTGTFGVAAGQSVAAADTDYIVVKGYNWKDPESRDVNDKFDGTNGSKGTVLYSAYAMPDGFNEAFDIDTSSYDYIKIFTNFTGTRRASLMDYAFHQYNAKTINSVFDKENGTITSSSKQARTAGTLAAVAYSDNAPTAVVYNNTAVMGTANVGVQGKALNQIPVLAYYTLDCKDMLNNAEYIKYYYVESAVEPTLDDLSALTAENCVETYVLSYNISGVKAADAVRVSQGTAAENIGLPSTVTVIAAESEFDGIGVTWNTLPYNQDFIGEYVLTGTLNADDLAAKGLMNKNNIKASITVKVEAASVQSEKSVYGNVKFGGGGFVTGITVHPKNSAIVYARTDVGGAYRYNADKDTWTCITDWLPHFNLYGIDAIAVDPNNEDVVYICAGTYWYNAGHGIYKSMDKGETWQNISLPVDIESKGRVFSGNSVNRTAGESFAVDPNNSNILYCGTRVDGLYVSKDGGTSWTKTSLPVTATYKTNGSNVTGIRSIAIKDNGDTSTVYAGVYDYDDIEGGVYVSNDNGDTWSLISGSPAKPLNMKVAEDGNLYVSSGNTGISGGGDASFMKYDGTSWADLTPSGYNDAGSFDTYKDADGNLVIYLAESNKSAKVYKKVGNGTWTTALTWENVKTAYQSAGWFTDGHSALLGKNAYVGDLEIGERNGKHEMWISDGGVGIWHNGDIESNIAAFSANVDGVEVTSTTSIAVASDSKGAYKLLSSNADYGIAATSDVSDASKAVNIKSINGKYFQVKDIAICPDNSNYVAFTASHEGELLIVTSKDGGKTWSEAAALDDTMETALEAKIAIGESNSGVPAIVVLPNGENNVEYSADFGKTWELSYVGSDELVINAYNANYQNITASGNCFYIYDSAKGKVYASQDGGATFTENYSSMLTIACNNEDNKAGIRPAIAANPVKAGEVWVSNSKLYKSTDYGATFAEVSADVEIKGVRGVSFGKGITDDTPSVFLLATVDSVYGLYRSDDNGGTWIKLNDSSVSYAIPTTEIAGDMEIRGRVYIATGGRGIMMLDMSEESKATAVSISKTTDGYKAAVSNYTGSAVIIAVSYGESGAVENVVAGDSKTIDKQGELTVKFESGENTKVKVFVWESVESMKPVGK